MIERYARRALSDDIRRQRRKLREARGPAPAEPTDLDAGFDPAAGGPGRCAAPCETALSPAVTARAAPYLPPPTAASRGRNGKRRKTLLFSAAILLAMTGAAVFGWHWWTVGRFLESTDDATLQGDITAVSTRVEGYVRQVLVKDNQPVKAGDVLATLDTGQAAAKVLQALERIEAQRDVLAVEDSRIARQAAVIDEVSALISQAEAEQRRSWQDFGRAQTLARQDIISRQRLDGSQADAAKAAAEVQKEQARLAVERSELAALQAERKRNEAILADTQAAYQVAQIDFADSKIRAPVDGIVANRGVQVGQLARPGTQLLSLVPTNALYIVANFKETQLARMRPGQRVAITVDAFSDRSMQGVVDSFSAATGSLFSLLPPENASGNFTKVVQRLPVRIALPADDPLIPLLRPGLSVTATVDTRAGFDHATP